MASKQVLGSIMEFLQTCVMSLPVVRAPFIKRKDKVQEPSARDDSAGNSNLGWD